MDILYHQRDDGCEKQTWPYLCFLPKYQADRAPATCSGETDGSFMDLFKEHHMLTVRHSLCQALRVQR